MAYKAGDSVWYRITLFGEWVPATVIDIGDNESPFGVTLEEDHLNLEITLDPKRHSSSTKKGTRFNVPPGDAIGCYRDRKPRDADRNLAEDKADDELVRIVGHAIMTGGDPVQAVRTKRSQARQGSKSTEDEGEGSKKTEATAGAS